MTAKRLWLAVAVVLAALALPIGRVDARGSNRDFWLLNETGRTITSVQLSPHGWNTWANNVLAGTSLPPYTGSKVLFVYDVAMCSMDVRVGYANGKVETYSQGRNLCRTSAIQFLEGYNLGLIVDMTP